MKQNNNNGQCCGNFWFDFLKMLIGVIAGVTISLFIVIYLSMDANAWGADVNVSNYNFIDGRYVIKSTDPTGFKNAVMNSAYISSKPKYDFVPRGTVSKLVNNASKQSGFGTVHGTITLSSLVEKGKQAKKPVVNGLVSQKCHFNMITYRKECGAKW